METHTIDAEGKSMGRVASEAAKLLMGKHKTTFVKNSFPKLSVKIVNVSKLKILESKKLGKVYTHYTGYPGGLKKETMGQVIEKKGNKEALRKAVRGMLPTNTLRDRMIKQLTISE